MTLQKKCLIVDKMHGSIITLLQAQGFTVDYLPGISRKELLATIEQYDGLIIRSKTAVDKALIEAATSLKFVGRAGAGIDQLDVALLEARNITIVNAPEGNRDALGEHALAMLLALLNKINIADAQVKNGIWDREANRGVELMGKTVGIIGFGNMGRAFAQRLACFGCNILAFDKYLLDYSTDFAQEATLDRIFKEADILSLHIPLTDETKAMVSDKFLLQFKKPFYFLNTARGEIAPFNTIVNGLKNGNILGAALDVLENEKLNNLSDPQKAAFELLVKFPNVVLTPHVAGWTYESYEKISSVLAEKISQIKINHSKEK